MSKARLPRAGFTLLEVMLGAALLLLIGTMVVTVLVPSFRSLTENQKRVSMEQQGVVVFQRLSDDLQDALPSAISISATPPVLAGQPLEGFTSSGGSQFATHFWVYYLVGEKLRRTIWKAPGPPSLSATPQAESPTRLPPADLAKFPVTNLPKAQPLCDKVTSFVVTHAGVGTSVAGPITVELLLGGTATETARVKMRRVFSPRLGE